LELKEDLDQGKARGNAARQTAGVLTQRGVRCNTAEGERFFKPVSVIARLDRAIQ
jgi:hypothetical protein